MSLKSAQQRFVQLRENKLFETFVIFVIVLSALVIGVKTYPIPDWSVRLIIWLDMGITLFFLVEISIRLMASESVGKFFKNGWNVFDFVIVVASLVPLEGSETAFLGRLLRIFRVLRLVAIIPELRVLLSAFMTAIPRMGYVSLLMFIIFYIYGAMGSIFFASINPELWENISISMLTLFRVATFEDWTDVMYETMAVYPISWLYYLTFIFVVAFLAAVETSRLDGRLIRLGVGIGKEDLARERMFDDRLGEDRLGLGVVIIRDVQKLSGLSGDRRDQANVS